MSAVATYVTILLLHLRNQSFSMPPLMLSHVGMPQLPQNCFCSSQATFSQAIIWLNVVRMYTSFKRGITGVLHCEWMELEHCDWLGPYVGNNAQFPTAVPCFRQERFRRSACCIALSWVKWNWKNFNEIRFRLILDSVYIKLGLVALRLCWNTSLGRWCCRTTGRQTLSHLPPPLPLKNRHFEASSPVPHQQTKATTIMTKIILLQLTTRRPKTAHLQLMLSPFPVHPCSPFPTPPHQQACWCPPLGEMNYAWW